MGNGSDKETEVQEVQEVMAMASLDTAEDTVAEVADTESRHTCKTCGKLYLIQNRNFMCTIRPMFRSGASYVGKNSMVRISQDTRCRKKNGGNGTSDVVTSPELLPGRPCLT